MLFMGILNITSFFLKEEDLASLFKGWGLGLLAPPRIKLYFFGKKTKDFVDTLIYFSECENK